MPETVLVTGGSGFLGLHTILQLLDRGYRVRTTVRSPAGEAQVREIAGDGIEFFAADLLADDGWAAAADGADFVLHVASPFPGVAPDHEDDLIIPAREGTLRVLRAARDAGVQRTVVTSSFAAVGYGRRELGDHVFTEEDWTDPSADIGAYIKSKAIAERAAWDFARGEMELAVVNPVGIFGPVLGPDRSASIGLISALLGGAMAGGMPRLAFSVVDVRDAADLHLRAMTDPAAAGERFIAAAGDGVWLRRHRPHPARAPRRRGRERADERAARRGSSAPTRPRRTRWPARSATSATSAPRRRAAYSGGSRVRPRRRSSPPRRACWPRSW